MKIKQVWVKLEDEEGLLEKSHTISPKPPQVPGAHSSRAGNRIPFHRIIACCYPSRPDATVNEPNDKDRNGIPISISAVKRGYYKRDKVEIR